MGTKNAHIVLLNISFKLETRYLTHTQNIMYSYKSQRRCICKRIEEYLLSYFMPLHLMGWHW